MNKILIYFWGTLVGVLFGASVNFIFYVISEIIVKYFLRSQEFLQVIAVWLVVTGVFWLIAILLAKFAEVKEYIKIIKQIDRNPNTPSAADQVEDYSFKSHIKEIV